MPYDHPKFSAFHTWALQLDPRAKNRATARKASPLPPPSEPPISPLRRFYLNNRSDVHAFAIQLAVGLILTAITLAFTLTRSESSAPARASPLHPWDEDMTVTPAQR